VGKQALELLRMLFVKRSRSSLAWIVQCLEDPHRGSVQEESISGTCPHPLTVTTVTFSAAHKTLIVQVQNLGDPHRGSVGEEDLASSCSSGNKKLLFKTWIVQVHYLGDPHRGSVWEEAIINCPRHIQLLCMSATVQNPDDLGGWISKVRGRRTEPYCCVIWMCK